MKDVDNLIRSIDTGSGNYSTLCARWQGTCVENNILGLGESISEIENGTLRMSYPVMFDPKTYESYLLPFVFGGIELNNETNSVRSVKAAQFWYFVEADAAGR
jgi:hypothetical protein